MGLRLVQACGVRDGHGHVARRQDLLRQRPAAAEPIRTVDTDVGVSVTVH